MINNIPVPDGRDQALLWLHTLLQAEKLVEIDGKLEAKRAEVNAAVDAGNAKVEAALAEADRIIQDANARAKLIEDTASESAKRITAEAIAKHRDAEKLLAEYDSRHQALAEWDRALSVREEKTAKLQSEAEMDRAVAAVAKRDAEELKARLDAALSGVKAA